MCPLPPCHLCNFDEVDVIIIIITIMTIIINASTWELSIGLEQIQIATEVQSQLLKVFLPSSISPSHIYELGPHLDLFLCSDPNSYTKPELHNIIL